MASSWESLADAFVADLQTVSGLTTATVPASNVHKLAPWDPQNLYAPVGERHLAVWPTADTETAQGLTTASIYLFQSWAFLVWENAGTEESRREPDYPSTQAWFTLQEAVRARLLSYMRTKPIVGNEYVYEGTTFNPTPQAVRWFACSLRVQVPKDY